MARTRRQTTYAPVWADWLWHVVLPDIAYATLAVAAFLVLRGDGEAVFAIAASALAPLLIGIHNAWDTVTYLVVAARDDADASKGE